MNLRERFNQKWIPHPRTGCWIWIGASDPDGYGYLHLQSHPRIGSRAHRTSWELNCGSIPEGMNVLHHCDNARCVNPEHLFIGSQADNINDMGAKGRARGGRLSGSNHPGSKITEEDVVAIRNSTESLSEISKKYGLRKNHICDIRAFRCWKQVI